MEGYFLSPREGGGGGFQWVWCNDSLINFYTHYKGIEFQMKSIFNEVFSLFLDLLTEADEVSLERDTMIIVFTVLIYRWQHYEEC